VWGDTGRIALVPVNTATCKTTHTHTLVPIVNIAGVNCIVTVHSLLHFRSSALPAGTGPYVAEGPMQHLIMSPANLRGD
jgi:hypothetical protein